MAKRVATSVDKGWRTGLKRKGKGKIVRNYGYRKGLRKGARKK